MNWLASFALLNFTVAAFAAQKPATLEWNRLAPLPDANGVAAPFAGVSSGALVVAGGANFPNAKPWEGGSKVWHDDVFVLSRPDGEWQRAGQLPHPLAYGVSATYGGEMICVGGSDEGRHHAEVFALRWRGGKISTRPLPSLPRPIANACGAVINGTLYIAGGISEPTATNALPTFFALDLNEPNSWRELPTWPGPARMLAMAAAQNEAFFLIGGVELLAGERGTPERRYLRDAFRFAPGRKRWERIADLPFALAGAPTIAPDALVILGGDDGSRAHLPPTPTHPGFNDAVLAYDMKRDVWTRIGTSLAPRATVPTVFWNGAWIMPSGEVRPGVRSPEVWDVHIAR